MCNKKSHIRVSIYFSRQWDSKQNKGGKSTISKKKYIEDFFTNFKCFYMKMKSHEEHDDFLLIMFFEFIIISRPLFPKVVHRRREG